MGGVGERSRWQVVAYLVVGALAVFAGVRYLGGDAQPSAAPVTVEGADTAGAEGPGAGAPAGRLYVHVAGAVRDEGLYRLPAGTRVGAAIERAGGPAPSAELSAVNLAAELQDGQQVVVPRHGEVAALGAVSPPPATATATATGTDPATGAPAAPISLAQATPEQLDATVDGIGPVLAGRIIEFRDERGGVRSIDELREVDGIGDERLADLREALVP